MLVTTFLSNGSAKNQGEGSKDTRMYEKKRQNKNIHGKKLTGEFG